MMIPAEESDKSRKGQGIIKGGIFDKVKMPDGKGVDAGIGEKIWIVSRDKPRYDEIFSSLEQHNNKITGQKKTIFSNNSDLTAFTVVCLSFKPEFINILCQSTFILNHFSSSIDIFCHVLSGQKQNYLTWLHC